MVIFPKTWQGTKYVMYLFPNVCPYYNAKHMFLCISAMMKS